MNFPPASLAFAHYLGVPASAAVTTARQLASAASTSVRRVFRRPSPTPFADAVGATLIDAGATHLNDSSHVPTSMAIQAIATAERARCHAIMSQGLQLGMVHAAMIIAGSDETTERAISLLNRCAAAKDMDRADSIASGRGNIYQGSK